MADRSLGQFVVYSLPAPTLPPASSDVATSPGGEACYQSIYLSMAPPQRSASPRARRTGDAAERGGSVDETGGGDHEHTDEESESESEDEDEDVDTTDTTDTESSSWTGGFSSYATATVSTDGESRYVALDEYIVDANGDEDQDAVRTALVEEMDEVELKRRLLFALSTLPARERSLVLQQLIPADGLPAHAKQEQDIRKREEKEKEKEKQREEVDIEAELREAFQAATQGKPVHDPEAEQKLRRDLRKLLVRRRSSGLKQKHLSYDRNWNEEYQSLVDKVVRPPPPPQPPTPPPVLICQPTCSGEKQGIWSISPTNAQVLSNLMHDFMFNVETYASVIINELNVDVSKKTIKPVDVGGVAGGQKFVVQGILFKAHPTAPLAPKQHTLNRGVRVLLDDQFCKDPLVSAKPPVWLYGGDRPRDDFAMKAAGLELQGLGLLATPALMASICHPLMALIDYKGFRMVAVCLLPLAKTSLRYGSDDGGKTVVASDPVLNQIMDKVGQIYNLKKHTVGRDRVPLVGPGDIECHLGTDGRYYALDFARMMPPEAPSASNGPCSDRGVFFKMLRPELVRQFRVPLSSDAFTGWSRYDTDIEGSERDIREATRHLFEEVIPALARDLDQLDVADFLESVLTGTAEIRFLLIKLATRINTVHEMHRRGVNMRHIGKVRAHVRDACWSGVLLAEAVSRCIKHLIRHKMRKTVLRSHGVSSESACKDLVIEHVNIYFGNTPKKSDRFWKKKIKRVAKQRFPGLLTAKERKPTYDLRKSLSLRLVFLLTERWSVLRLTEGIKRELMTKDLHHVRILPGDVEEITASVRHSPVIHLIDASLYLEEAMNPQCDNDEALRLLGSANEHMTAAVKGKPRIAYILWSLGRVEAEAARRSRFDQDCEGQFEKAIVSHRQALEVEPRQGAYNSLASALDAFADKLEEFIGQEKKRWQSRRERREMRRSGQKVKRRAGADVAKPQWTEEQIREKEEKVRTLRLQAAEARGKAKELDSSANIFKFCANTLSGASEPVESFSD